MIRMVKRSLAVALLALIGWLVYWSATRVTVPSEAFDPAAQRRVVDALGRQVVVPREVGRVICSGSGCLRLVTYLGCEDRVVAVDDLESRQRRLDARPYALSHPGYRHLPVFGAFRGRDDPEAILGLDPGPEVVFKTNPDSGHDSVELAAKTGLPVVALRYGNLGQRREHLFAALRTMGVVLGCEDRAEAVCDFFAAEIAELERRTRDVPAAARSGVYVGGIAYRGPHGYLSTEPGYPPFAFLGARNVAAAAEGPGNARIDKEQLLVWDPDVLFLDLSTLRLGEEAGGLYELRTDPVLRSLRAVRAGRVYGLLPYNWYSRNYGSVLADAWYIGTVLYPERFADVDPAAKADAIYRFLVGAPVYAEMNRRFGGMAFAPVDLGPPR